VTHSENLLKLMFSALYHAAATGAAVRPVYDGIVKRILRLVYCLVNRIRGAVRKPAVLIVEGVGGNVSMIFEN